MTNGQSAWDLTGHSTSNMGRGAEAKVVPKANICSEEKNPTTTFWIGENRLPWSGAYIQGSIRELCVSVPHVLWGITTLPQEWPILLPAEVSHQPAFGFLALLPISSCHGLLSCFKSAACFIMSLQQIIYLLLWCQLCILLCVKKQKEYYDRNIFSLSLPSFFLVWCVYTPFYRVWKTCSFNSRGIDHIRNVPNPLVSSNRYIHWSTEPAVSNMLQDSVQRRRKFTSIFHIFHLKNPSDNTKLPKSEASRQGSRLFDSEPHSNTKNQQTSRQLQFSAEKGPFILMLTPRCYIFTLKLSHLEKGGIFREMVKIRVFFFLCLANEAVVN